MKYGTKLFYLVSCIILITSLYKILFSPRHPPAAPLVMSDPAYSSFLHSLPPIPVDCKTIITKTRLLLINRNISTNCAALQEENCQETFKTISDLADPFSVFLRSASCQIDFPRDTTTTKKERDFPLAFFITTFKDARNLEQLLQGKQLKNLMMHPNLHFNHFLLFSLNH